MEKRGVVSHQHATFVLLILAAAVVMSALHHEQSSSSITGQQIGVAPQAYCYDKDNDLYSGNNLPTCGLWDCNDNDPNIHPSMRENCKDHIDQDCDTHVDCADNDCDTKQGGGGRCEYGTEVTCDDMFDNDADGLEDCDDTVDCMDDPFCDDDEDIIHKWSKVEIDFQENVTRGEKDPEPNNPFTNYQLDITFTSPTNKQHVVPGFFDGNGMGEGSGDTWRVRFRPDEVGDWTYVASFTYNGNPQGPIHGQTDTFMVDPVAPDAEGFAKWGLLEESTTGSLGHYLKFRDGPYFIKTGTDSPENPTGYAGFDDTSHDIGQAEGDIHFFAPHINDYNNDGPFFVSQSGPHAGTTSEGIIGAINYLASVGVNSFYFIPMNIGGDAMDSWPFADAYPQIDPTGNSANDNMHYDISKLTQWEMVFDHLENKNMQLFFVLNEAESKNKEELDDATLGPERKLFYRELIARFGHHLAITWSISEEYNIGHNIGPQVKDWADYIQSIDPSDHPITVHNAGSATNAYNLWLVDGFFGHQSLSMAALQDASGSCDFQGSDGKAAERFREKSQQENRPLVVGCDELLSFQQSDPDTIRKTITYPVLFSGGGVQYYDGDLDQSLEDFRINDQVYNEARLAREFLEDNVPFWNMIPDDDLVSNVQDPQAFAQVGQYYALYLPHGGNPSLQLPGGTYTVQWYRPDGFYSQESTVTGGGATPLGNPPAGFNDDFSILVKKV